MHHRTGIIDNVEACITGINDSSRAVDNYWPVSTTPVSHNLTSINDTSNAYIAGVNDTSEVHSCTKLMKYQTYLIPNLSETKLILYQTYYIPNLFDTKLIR